MDNETKENLKNIINSEIGLEDDMLELYSVLLKNDSYLQQLEENDKNLATEILNSLLRDTARHKKTMTEIISNLQSHD